MRGITLTQPYATLVAVGAKAIETRSWATSFRGPIAIHAAQGLGPVGGKLGLQALCADSPFREVIAPLVHEVHQTRAGERFPSWDLMRLPFGAIVAVAELVSCVPVESARFVGSASDGWSHERTGLSWPLTDQERAFGDYSPNRYAWLLADIRRLPTPIPYRGALGLWRVPDELERRIQEAIQ